jgi:hypothetical protein
MIHGSSHGVGHFNESGGGHNVLCLFVCFGRRAVVATKLAGVMIDSAIALTRYHCSVGQPGNIVIAQYWYC